MTENIIEKDEYELCLYGFTLGDFKKENFQFFRKQITNSMKFMRSKLMDAVKDKPGMSEVIANLTNEIENKIFESCKSNIENIANAEVEKCLRIPENVILSNDRVLLQSNQSTNVSELEKEIEDLVRESNRNSLFLKYLEEELDSYNIKDDSEIQIFSMAEFLTNKDSYNFNILIDALKKMGIDSVF